MKVGGAEKDDDGVFTCDSLVLDPGSRGRLNFFWDPIAAGNGGAENMAATTLMRVIHDCICSAFLQETQETP